MQMNEYKIPMGKMKFVSQETKQDRLEKILEELYELDEAVQDGTNIQEEATDVIVATYQMFEHLGLSQSQIYEGFKSVYEKNERRGYHAQ